MKPRDPMLGTVIADRYRLDERIGSGGMAVVYRATQTAVGRQVAIKILSAQLTDRSGLVARFQLEARVISRLRHPNTLKLYDVGRTHDGRLYIVTELLEGKPLHHMMGAGEISPLRAIRILGQVAESLSEAHAAGIVHRDLKPANLVIERVGRRDVAKVLDFGIAKVMGGSMQTQTGAVFGTPTYMSPEQAAGTAVDAKADVYSLGVMLYECLAGELPFRSSSTPVLIQMQIEATPPPISSRPGAVLFPPALEALTMRMLEKGPSARPTMEEVQAQLALAERAMEREAAFADQAPTQYVTIEPPRSTPPPTTPPPSGGSAFVLAAILGLLMGGAAVAAALLLG